MSTTDETDERALKRDSADKAEHLLEHLITAKGGKRREGQVEMARAVATALSEGRPELMQGGTGIGKALDVDTPIPTLEGWVRMGDLEAGVHHPFDENGVPCNITEGFDVLRRRTCYELSFLGGGTLVADGQHQWNTVSDAAATQRASGDPWEGAQTRTTTEIAQTLRRRKRPNHRIPTAKPIQIEEQKLPIDPYELGFWLGGTERRSPNMALVAKTVRPEQPMQHFEVADVRSEVSITPTEATAKALKKLGLLTSERFIPDKYMFSSEAQRRALLAGLMDASGQPHKSQRQIIAQVTAYKNQFQLMKDIHALACSLGLRAASTTREFRNGSYQQVTFSPDQQVFRVPFKAAQAGDFDNPGRRMVGHRSVVAVEKVKTRPVRCISVDSDSRLYLAGRDFIPTHNSMAYLAGALASGKRTAVAPHTKALQDQLGHDLELVVEAFKDAGTDDESLLDHQPSYGLIKGRSSYYCGNRVATDEAEDTGQMLDIDGSQESFESNSQLGQEVALLHKWAQTTETGDRSDAPAVSGKAWSMVCGSTDDCSANGCKKNPSRCFAQRAHEKAAQADIVVVNQSYLAAAMKIEFLELAECEAVVVDEAHEFPMVVADTFGAVLKRKRVEQTLKRATNLLAREDLIDEQTVEKWSKGCEHYLDELERALAKMSKFGSDREIVETPGVVENLESLVKLFDPIRRKTRAAADRAADDKEKSARQTLLQAVKNLIEDFQIILEGSNDFQVSWADKERGEAVLHSARFDVSETIHEHLIDRICGGRLVMTSATMTVGGAFDYPAQQMGFTLDADTYPWKGRIVASPFDYKKQGMIWLPPHMPAPINTKDGKAEYAEAVAEVATGVARAAGGRTLVLCTSRQSVETVGQRMEEALEPEGITVLTQRPGGPSQALAKEFADNPHSVLVGTRTFWTGVSVEGDTCVAVVVDKIPFPTPSDPIIAARTEKVDRLEGNRKGFIKVSLSEAILTIVQGVGRLIRTVNDRGVVVLCDPRVNPQTPHVKGYYTSIRDSLPAFTGTGSKEAVHSFLRDINQTASDEAGTVEVNESAESVSDVVV